MDHKAIAEALENIQKQLGFIQTPEKATLVQNHQTAIAALLVRIISDVQKK